jgi:hypothetical protein
MITNWKERWYLYIWIIFLSFVRNKQRDRKIDSLSLFSHSKLQLIKADLKLSITNECVQSPLCDKTILKVWQMTLRVAVLIWFQTIGTSLSTRWQTRLTTSCDIDRSVSYFTLINLIKTQCGGKFKLVTFCSNKCKWISNVVYYVSLTVKYIIRANLFLQTKN